MDSKHDSKISTQRHTFALSFNCCMVSVLLVFTRRGTTITCKIEVSSIFTSISKRLMKYYRILDSGIAHHL